MAVCYFNAGRRSNPVSDRFGDHRHCAAAQPPEP